MEIHSSGSWEIRKLNLSDQLKKTLNNKEIKHSSKEKSEEISSLMKKFDKTNKAFDAKLQEFNESVEQFKKLKEQSKIQKEEFKIENTRRKLELNWEKPTPISDIFFNQPRRLVDYMVDIYLNQQKARKPVEQIIKQNELGFELSRQLLNLNEMLKSL